jgi:hypothetical protein
MEPTISLADYYDRLEQHDWHYRKRTNLLDYQNGSAMATWLWRLAYRSPAHRALHDGFVAHHFNGQAWQTPPVPKPSRPVGNENLAEVAL